MNDDLLGFEEVDKVPPAGRGGGRPRSSIYDPLFEKVREGKILSIDKKNKVDASSLIGSLNKTIRRRGYKDIKVSMRGTVIYIWLTEEA